MLSILAVQTKLFKSQSIADQPIKIETLGEIDQNILL